MLKLKYFAGMVVFATSAICFAQQNFEKRTDPGIYDAPVMKAIAYGITAPSPHNTQSWYIDTISSTEMYLYVKHVIPRTDPPARQIHMGAGCFIELAAVGMSAEGYETHVEYFPLGDYEIAAYEMAPLPLAKISLIKNESLQKDVLYDFIYQRGTNRKPYKGKMISTEEFGEIRRLMGNHNTKLLFIEGRNAMKPYLDIFSEAMRIEIITKSTNEETRHWFRFSEQERAERKDGISIPQMGYDGTIRNIIEKSLRGGDSITWHSEKTIKATMKGINKGIYSSKGVIIFTTASNTKTDWVQSGRDYARYNIAIAKLGFVTHPYNQVIQEYPEMKQLQARYRQILKLAAGEKTQMIVRIGRAKPTYKSWRRNAEDYLLH